MTPFRQAMQKAIDTGRARYYKRQKYLLRPMKICGRLEIPNVRAQFIVELFATNGSKEVYIQDFLEEYFGLVSKIIDGQLKGYEGGWPKIVDYALEKEYNVTFQKGDIMRNQHYDPSITQVQD